MKVLSVKDTIIDARQEENLKLHKKDINLQNKLFASLVISMQLHMPTSTHN